jgi:hypothetical protein
LDDSLDASLRASLRASLDDSLNDSLYDSLYDSLRASLRASLDVKADGKFKLFYCGVFWGWWLARYLIAAKWGAEFDMQKLALLYGFVRFCPIIGIFRKDDRITPFVMPKPSRVCLEERGSTEQAIKLPIFTLHGNGVPSIEYPGLNLYHWNNVKIPERMGKVKSSEWKAEWLLDEPNAEIKRLLITEIGYDKIAAQLNAQTLDTWTDEGRGGQYDLVKIDNEVDVEPILLCKMSCPSTGAPYMIRVPPEITKAYDAITWIRHGYKPEEFICQH